MEFRALPLIGVYVVKSSPHTDHRGSFARVFCNQEFSAVGLTKPIVQMNFSRTTPKGAIRGMHFQFQPHAEIKIVRCLRGAVFDVAIDLRADSETFLHWHGEILTPENMHAMYIPEGFAHGFQALESDSELLYCHTAHYAPQCEGAVRYDDPTIGIQWPLPVSDLSQKDQSHPFITNNFMGLKL